MKLLIFCFILFNLFLIQVSALDFKRTGDQIYLSDPSCDEVASANKSLAEWKNNSQPNDRDNKCSPNQSPSKSPLEIGDCKLDITNCLPDHVQKYQGVWPKNRGPNCWNLALVMKNILPALRLTTPDEMTFYMRPPLCRPLKNEEKRLPGDVGAIRKSVEGQEEEIHGFIYVSEKIAYSKSGMSTLFPYSLRSLNDMYDGYKVSKAKECRQNDAPEPNNCEAKTSYFRCISMEQYLTENPKVPGELKDSFEKLSSFEKCFQSTVINGSPLSINAQTNLLDVSKALAVYLESELKKNNSSNDEQRTFLLGSLQLRLSAIAEQLGFTEYRPLGGVISQMANQLKKSISELAAQ
jgi:hypothetical protein